MCGRRMETTVTERKPVQAEEDVLRFVRLCLRGRWEPEALEAAHRLATRTELDWAELVELAIGERLGSLLYEVVHGRNLVPPEVEEDLYGARIDTALRDQFLREELVTILRRLATKGVEVLLLKGAALAQTVYGGAGVRPMGDLDFLLHREDAPRALDLLGQAGYRRTSAEVHPGADLAYENEVQLVRGGLVPFVVEVHWSLFDVPYYQQSLPMAWFWDSALAIQIDNTPARVLGPAAQVLHLCGHLVLHHGGERARLLWLHDVAEVLVHYRQQMDWQDLLDRAQQYRLVLPLQQVLPQLADEWGAPIPAEALSKLDALRPSTTEMQVMGWRTASERPVAQRFWSDLASMRSWRQRLHYAWIQLFPSAAYMSRRYGIRHRLLVPLYYPYRWWVGFSGACRALLARRQPDAGPPATET